MLFRVELKLPTCFDGAEGVSEHFGSMCEPPIDLLLGSWARAALIRLLFRDVLGPGWSRVTPLTCFRWAQPAGPEGVTCAVRYCLSFPGPWCPCRRPSRPAVPLGNLSCVECVACSAEATVGDRGSLRACSVASQRHRFWAKGPKQRGQHLNGCERDIVLLV